jgi:hypothetical protein
MRKFAEFTFHALQCIRLRADPCATFLLGSKVREPLDAGTQGTSASYGL